jgi:transposase
VPELTVKPSKVRRRGKAAAAVELEIDGVAMKIGRGADATLIRAVIDALSRRP